MFFTSGGFPFGFAGGFGDDDAPRGRAQNKPVDNESFYKLLGVAKDASEADIRKAYRKLALKEHPDKGGDPDKFKAISRAYEVLSDPKKRAIYDESGEEGLEGSGNVGEDAHDIFSQLFGGGGGRRRAGPRKGQDIVHPIEVSLEDLYNGKISKLNITRDTTCKACQGKGTADGSTETDCSDCRGRGMVTMVSHMGPGMIRQMTAPCNSCRGTGKNVPESKKCKGCGGKKTQKEKKLLEVHIEKGMKSGSKIVMRGEAGDEPGVEPGDVIFVVQQKPHPDFRRDGNDLFMEKDIPLVDALCGCKFLVRHLDNRRLRVATEKGEVISPGQFKSIEHAGMPVPGTGGTKFGDLYIRFNVVFPPSGSLDDKTRTLLTRAIPRVLPPRVKSSLGRDDEKSEDADYRVPVLDDHVEVEAADDAEDVALVDVTVDTRAARVREQKESAGRAEGEAYDSEEEGGGARTQRVQCAQQ